jgi:RNA polymerase sigma factor (sigma-70 family)
MNKSNKIIDGRLVLQYQSGNANALTELVQRWHKQFCNKAYWIVKDADVAKDVAQDSWRTIITKISNLKDPNSFGGWASRIVYTKAIDSIKFNIKERENLKDYQNEIDLVDTKSENNEELKLALLKAIKSLPERQKMVIQLFYVEEYSLKEIGGILNISVGTAKSRLFHAREKLKIILKENKVNQ